MTRRKFIEIFIKAGAAVSVGAWRILKKVSPRKFVRAVRTKKYPGSLRPMQDIYKQGKWSG